MSKEWMGGTGALMACMGAPQSAEIGRPLREIEIRPLVEPVPDVMPAEEPAKAPARPAEDPEHVPA